MKDTLRRIKRGNSAESNGKAYAWTAQAIVVFAAIAVATTSHAAPIRFNNPPGDGHFDWRPLAIGNKVYLNVLMDAASQTPDSGGSGAFIQETRNFFGTQVRRGGPSGEGPQCVLNPSGYNRYLLPVDAGVEVPTPTGDGFSLSGVTYWTEHPDGLWGGEGGPPTLFTAGEETYLGVQFLDPGGSGLFNYGWIGVMPEWTTVDIGGTPTDVLVLDAFAWAYETEPGVPIVTPEPSSLAALAFGVAFAGLARRRS